MAEATSKLIYRCTVCHAVYSAGERFCPLDAGPIAPDGDTDPRIGRTIDGRYFVRRLIGRGGMGTVYEADHVGLDKRVAIKFLSINKTDRDALARFRREAKIASKIVHEHVVQIFDVGTADADTDFIVMELIEGKDLAAVLREGGPIEPARTVSIARKVLRGLRAIHEAGIVHRDIKPANILLSPRIDDRDFVKIMDFGISRQIHGDTITHTGAIIGTPEYMSPEQLLADDIDQRADLYAVGIMMFRMVSGKLPFTTETFDRASAASPYVEVPALDQGRPDVPRGVAEAVAKAVQKDREHRFADAQGFLTALDALGTMSSTAPVDPVTSQPVTGMERTESPIAVADTAIAPSGLVPSMTPPNVASSGPAHTGLVSGITAPAKRTDPRVPVHHAAPTMAPATPAVTVSPTQVTRSRTGLWVTLGMLIAGATICIVVLATRESEPDSIATPTPPTTSTAAGGPPPTVSPSAGDKTKGLLEKARQAEAAGKLDEALEAYQAAFSIDQAPDTMFQVAELHERLGHPALASAAFQRYLHLAKDASDRDVVLARIAKLEKAASAGSQTAPGSGAPRVPSTTATAEPLEDCHCLPKGGIPDTQSLCAKPGPALCRCDQDGRHLCSTQVTQCAACPDPDVHCSAPGCSDVGLECADRNFDKPHTAGKHGDACKGFETWQLLPEAEGKLFCDICSGIKKPRQYQGHHGDVCTGFYRHTGEKVEGRLWCH